MKYAVGDVVGAIEIRANVVGECLSGEVSDKALVVEKKQMSYRKSRKPEKKCGFRVSIN